MELNITKSVVTHTNEVDGPITIEHLPTQVKKGKGLKMLIHRNHGRCQA